FELALKPGPEVTQGLLEELEVGVELAVELGVEAGGEIQRGLAAVDHHALEGGADQEHVVAEAQRAFAFLGSDAVDDGSGRDLARATLEVGVGHGLLQNLQIERERQKILTDLLQERPLSLLVHSCET